MSPMNKFLKSREFATLFPKLYIGIVLMVAFWSGGFWLARNNPLGFHISVLVQAAGVTLALLIAFLFFEHRTQLRQKRIDDSVRESTSELRNFATSVVITTAGKFFEKPLDHASYGPSNAQSVYREARSLVLDEEPPSTEEAGFWDYLWIFRKFEQLADRCSQTIRLFILALVEYNTLVRHIGNFEVRVREEGQIWAEFQRLQPDRDHAYHSWEETERKVPGRFPKPPFPDALPPEALKNLLSLSRLAVHLVDVLDSPEYTGDPEYENRRRFAPELTWRSRRWGDWGRG